MAGEARYSVRYETALIELFCNLICLSPPERDTKSMRATHFSQYLQDREELKVVDTPHWIYIAQAVLISILVLAFGLWLAGFIGTNVFFSDGTGLDSLINKGMGYLAFGIYWLTLIGTVIYFLNRVIFYLTTYVFQSNRRLFWKTGLLLVRVNEIDFDEIRSAHLNYGFFGRILGYAQPIMDARFVSDIKLPYIHCPEEALKVIHGEQDLQKDVSLSFITQGEGAEGHSEGSSLKTAQEHTLLLEQRQRAKAEKQKQQRRRAAYATDLVFVEGTSEAGNKLSFKTPRRRKTDKEQNKATKDFSSPVSRQITSGNDLEML